MLHRLVNLPNDQSFFLFGARQTGKSTLINSWIRGIEHLSFNLLESEAFLTLSRTPAELSLRVEAALLNRRAVINQTVINEIGTNQSLTSQLEQPFVLFIDEIQRIPELLNEVQLLLDTHHNLRAVLTGSSARKLRRIGTNLGGARLLNLALFPLTWPELAGQLPLDWALNFGTRPPVFNDLKAAGLSKEGELAATRRLKAYQSIYLEEEIRNEGLVRSFGDFSRFLEIAAQNNGGLVNFTNVARESQVARKTVEGYYQILIDTLIAHRLEPYEPSIRKRVALAPKIYLFDTGVVNAVTGSVTAPLTAERRGNLFETLGVCEAFRLLSYQESEAKLFFWRTKDGAEVDLLVEKHGKLIAAFEFKSGKQPSITRKQLGNFLEYFPDVPFYLVTEEKNQKITDSQGNCYGTMITFQQYIQLLQSF